VRNGAIWPACGVTKPLATMRSRSGWEKNETSENIH
jgi:hypothetical protein